MPPLKLDFRPFFHSILGEFFNLTAYFAISFTFSFSIIFSTFFSHISKPPLPHCIPPNLHHRHFNDHALHFFPEPDNIASIQTPYNDNPVHILLHHLVRAERHQIPLENSIPSPSHKLCLEHGAIKLLRSLDIVGFCDNLLRLFARTRSYQSVTPHNHDDIGGRKVEQLQILPTNQTRFTRYAS